MVDALKDILHKKVETPHVDSGEIWISPSDARLKILDEFVLTPSNRIALPIVSDVLTTNFSMSSRFAQAGLNGTLVDKGLIEITNYHPKNEYLFPKGLLSFGRYWEVGSGSLAGDDLDNIANYINNNTNTLERGSEVAVSDHELIIPIINDYFHIPGAVKVDKPIDLSSLPSGVERWKVKANLGTIESNLSQQPQESINDDFRLLLTPLIMVPRDIALVIQNPDSFNSTVIDGGFNHMIIGEFSDKLLKPGEARTEKTLRLKAYRIKTS